MKRFLLLTFVIACANTNTARAEDYPWIAEGLPQHLAARVSGHNQELQLPTLQPAQRWYVDTLKKWDTDSPIKVCFFGGSKELRARIAQVALRWTQIPGAHLPLDFGPVDNPRMCKISEFNNIRVGFSYSGYWSLVGQDSIEQASQYEQSMNFGRFAVNPPPEPTFTRIVLHEFGHALGFHHEHQNVLGPCQNDFNWPVVYQYLRGDPNYWDDSTIDFNMRSQPGEGDPGPFDRQSIMLYAFPPSFYVNGSSSGCFAGNNNDISDGDRQGLIALYGGDAAHSAELKRAAFESYTKVISESDRLTPEQKLGALTVASRLNAPTSAAKMETFFKAGKEIVGTFAYQEPISSKRFPF